MRYPLLRHTALALLGWYLMVPPSLSRPWSREIWHWFSPRVSTIIIKCDPNAPLSEWEQEGVFDKALECQAQQEKEPERTRQTLEAFNKALAKDDASDPDLEKEEINCSYEAKCIATDDPRLAK